MRLVDRNTVDGTDGASSQETWYLVGKHRQADQGRAGDRWLIMRSFLVHELPRWRGSAGTGRASAGWGGARGGWYDMSCDHRSDRALQQSLPRPSHPPDHSVDLSHNLICGSYPQLFTSCCDIFPIDGPVHQSAVAPSWMDGQKEHEIDQVTSKPLS